MKKFLSLMLACCAFAVMSNAQETGAECVDAVHAVYGADIRISGDSYWIKLKLSEFQESGISAFWYSSDSLFLEAYLLTGVFTKKCTPLNLSFMSAPNEKINIDANELLNVVESQMAKQGNLSEQDKESIRGSMVYLGLTPRSGQEGRFIINEFGIAAGSDCDNPWDVALNASYGLTPEENVFRLDAAQADSLHIVYEPMRASAKDMTVMHVDVRLGDCNGEVLQSGNSLDNQGEGIFIPRRSLLDSAVTLQKPLFFTVTRGDDYSTLAFRNVHVDEQKVFETLCEGESLIIGNRTFTEAGLYEFVYKEIKGDGVYYHNITLDIAVSDNCDDALEDVLAPVVAEKYIENGRLVILRNGTKYNAAGQIIR